MAKLTICEEACKGCSLCVDACPKHLLQLHKEKLNAKGYHPIGIVDIEACNRLCVLRPDVPGCRIHGRALRKGEKHGKEIDEGERSNRRGGDPGGMQILLGYPITPQNEIPEYMSRRLPKEGGAFYRRKAKSRRSTWSMARPVRARA